MIFCMVYLEYGIVWYRNASPVVKAVIALLIHPIISEVFVSLMRLNKGSGTRKHPFYDHLDSFCAELVMCLFKRFLFVNTDSVGETVLLVVLSGFEEVFMRATLESKEAFIRKLTGKRPLSEEELKSKRIVSIPCTDYACICLSYIFTLIVLVVCHYLKFHSRTKLDYCRCSNDDFLLQEQICHRSWIQFIHQWIIRFTSNSGECRSSIDG